MSTIKLTLMLSFILFSMQIFSQTKTPQEKAANQTKSITKACNLTKDQQARVEQILLTSIQEMDNLKEQQANQRVEHQQQLKDINDREDADLKATLTPEQYQKYITAKEEAKEKAEENKANGQTKETKQQQNNDAAKKTPLTPQEKAANQLKHINKTCNLTKDQMPKVEQILLTSNNNLDEVKKKETAFRGELFEKMKAMAEKEESDMKSVLTPEQYQKYIEMKTARKERNEQKH